MPKVAASLVVNVTANTSQAEKQLDSFGRSFHNIIAGGLAQRLGRGLLDDVRGWVTSGAEFEKSLLRVDRLAGNVGENVEGLMKKAFEVDRNTIFNAQEVVGVMEQLAREGFTAGQILDDYTDAAINFAAVINEDIITSANIFGNAARVFREEGLSAARVADILSQAILRSGRPASEFATGLQYLGSIAAELDVPLLDVSTALSFLQANGIKARSAGTGLRTMFLELASGGEKLAEIGITAFDPNTGAFVGLPSIIDQFHELISTMKDDEALAFLESFFGKPAASPLLALFRGGTEAYDEHQRKMESLGTASAFMSAIMDTTAGSIDRLGAAASNAGRLLGTAFGPVIRPVIDGLAFLLNTFGKAPPIIHAAVAGLTAVAGALAFIGGSLMIFKALGGFAIFTTALGAIGTVALIAAGAITAVGIALIFFKDKIDGVVDTVSGALGYLDDFFGYLGRFNNDQWMADGFWMEPLSERFGLTDFPQGARRTVHAIASIVEGVKDLWDGFREGGIAGLRRRLPGELKQIETAFHALRQELVEWLPEPLRDLAFNLGTIADAVFDVAAAFLTGGWDGLAERLPNEIEQAVNALGRIVVDVAEIGLNILGWTVSVAEDLWTAISRKVFELFGGDSRGFVSYNRTPGPGGVSMVTGIQTNAIPLGVLAVQIGGWLVSAAEDLGGAIVDKIVEWWPTIKDAGKDLAGYAITIKDFALNVDTSGLTTAITEKFKDLATPGTEPYEDMFMSGMESGDALGSAFVAGVEASFAAMFSSDSAQSAGEAAAGGAFGGGVLATLASSFVVGLATGLVKGIAEELDSPESAAKLLGKVTVFALGGSFAAYGYNLLRAITNAIFDVGSGSSYASFEGGDIDPSSIGGGSIVDGYVSRALDWIGGIIGAVVDGITGELDQIWEGTKGTYDMMGRLKDWFFSLFDGGGGASAADRLGGFFGSGSDDQGIKGVAKGIAEGIIDAFLSPFEVLPDIDSPLSGLSDSVTGWIGDEYDDIRDWMANNTPDFIKKLAAGDLVGAFKAAAGIGDGTGGRDTSRDGIVGEFMPEFGTGVPGDTPFDFDTGVPDNMGVGLVTRLKSSLAGAIAGIDMGALLAGLDPAPHLASLFADSKIQPAVATMTSVMSNEFTRAGVVLGMQTAEMTSTLTAFATNAGTAGTLAGNSFADGVIAGLNRAWFAAGFIVASIAATLASAAGSAYSSGIAVGAGFAGGILDSLPAVQAAASALAFAASGGLSAAIQEASPSKVTAEIGDNFAEGFIRQITAGQDRAYAAGRGMGSAAVDGLGHTQSRTATVDASQRPVVNHHYYALGAGDLDRLVRIAQTGAKGVAEMRRAIEGIA